MGSGSWIEWGLALATFFFLRWKYGLDAQFLKGLRQGLKRIEDLLFPPKGIRGTAGSSEHGHYKRIPVHPSHTAFTPKKVVQGPIDDQRSRTSFHFILDTLIDSEFAKLGDEKACFVCQNDMKDAVTEEIVQDVELKNILDYDTFGPEFPWYVRAFGGFFYWWRKWWLGSFFHVVTEDEMLEDERVKWTVRESALSDFRDRGDEDHADLPTLVEKYTKAAKSTVRKMRAKMPPTMSFAIYVRIASWIIGLFLSWIYPKILVRERQVELIKEARKKGVPILYLPLHRSHIDYILVSWSLVNLNLRSPIVAAGENLNIPVFSLLMKSVGGFFIKRKFAQNKKDAIYRSVLTAYMNRTLTKDNDMEFFIEGGRTRTGKPCQPKGGLLNIVVDTLLSGRVDDILVIPVNFSYDKIVEGNYIREQLGQPKVSESFVSAIYALFSSLQPKYGDARIDYGHPFSMREFLELKRGDEGSGRSSSGIESGSSSGSEAGSQRNRRKMVDAVARHTLYEGVECYTLTSTSALAFLLLNKFRNGTDLKTLTKEMAGLRAEMADRGHDATFKDGEVEIRRAIKKGSALLGDNLITFGYKNGQRWIFPVTEVPTVIELSYYSNCVLPVFALEAVVASSVFKLLGDLWNNNYENHEKLRLEEVVRTSLEYSEVLSQEFILNPPCTSLAQRVARVVDGMKAAGIFSEDEEGSLEIRSSEALERLVFLKNLLRPLLDTYITAAGVLVRLVENEADERGLQMEMLSEVKRELKNKAILYGESVALDPIRNFVQVLVKWEVLSCQKTDERNVYSCGPDFNSVEAMEEVIESLRKLRV